MPLIGCALYQAFFAHCARAHGVCASASAGRHDTAALGCVAWSQGVLPAVAGIGRICACSRQGTPGALLLPITWPACPMLLLSIAYLQDGWTALHKAAWRGHLECCRLLVHWGAYVDHENKASSDCCLLKHAMHAQALLPACTSLQKGKTPLHYAAENGHVECCRLFVEKASKATVELKVWPACCALRLPLCLLHCVCSPDHCAGW
jgi:hypothetical protein